MRVNSRGRAQNVNRPALTLCVFSPKILVPACRSWVHGPVRIIGLAALVFLAACVDLSTICPNKPDHAQGVFGEIDDPSNTLEQNVKVDAYTTLNGVQDTMIATRQTTRGGYQFMLLAGGPYSLCAKGVCTLVTVPTGLVELSAVDAAAGLAWDAPVAVPPEQVIGPCTFGN